MPRKITASDRKSLIRLASALPKGDPTRRVLLALVPSVQEQEDYAAAEVDGAGKLSQVDPILAKYLVRTGLEDGVQAEDKIQVKPAKFKAMALKPSQTTIKLWGVLGMALMMIRKGKIGGDLGAIISSDNYIMDGHHRWAASILAGGKGASVGGWQAALPGKELVKVLNIVSKGMFRVDRGNKGTGNITDVNPRMARELLEQYVVEGIKGEYPVSPEQVQKDLIKGFGSIERGIDMMSERTKLVNKNVPSWAPKRSDMPVIEPEETPAAAKALNQGRVNWQAPFLTEQERAESEAAAMRLASVLPKGSKERRDLLDFLRRGR